MVQTVVSNFHKTATDNKAPITEQWKKFKQQLNGIPTGQIAVISLQSLDKKKIALPADQIESYIKDNPGLEKTGDGHTGFAMAKALHAPFVVLRSEGNRREANHVLSGHLKDNSLIVITGHGSPNGNTISGNYVDAFDDSSEHKPNHQIRREPAEIVSSSMEAGLKAGEHITILLSICYGALGTTGADNSFAHKLAREFAKHGVSTSIIASDKPVRRFGYQAIKEGQLHFNSTTGMDKKDVCLFFTKVNEPGNNPDIETFKPDETIQLSSKGLQFIDPYHPEPECDKEPTQQELLKAGQSQNLPSDKQAPKSEAELNFYSQLRLLKNKIGDLSDRKDKAKENFWSNESIASYFKLHQLEEAYQAAKTLHEKLTEKGKFFFNDPTPKNYQVFKGQCEDHIKSARIRLEEHRGWSEFLGNLALGIATLGLGLLVKGAINLANNRSFIFFCKTDSERKLDGIMAAIDSASP
ncbi:MULTISPECIES: hypothetical protein [unclassified Legionella]|uniref:hypothetical protein n=1 Tax=unclassified Legionella TaxID=2622702 RepID=UPI001056461C|nr:MULTISPECIES: hypothetical protein [unclassified Legionella]MDI9819399.1 hypothetical protein [Legionella sp. PL877]